MQFFAQLQVSFALCNLKTAKWLNGSVLIAGQPCGTYLFGGRGSGQMWQMSQADRVKDKQKKKQLEELSLLCVQPEMSFFLPSNWALCTCLKKKKPKDTVRIVSSQCVFYAANFLMLQLATCHWPHQFHICMKHSHSPNQKNTPNQTKTKQNKKTPTHTIYQRCSLSLVSNACLPHRVHGLMHRWRLHKFSPH